MISMCHLNNENHVSNVSCKSRSQSDGLPSYNSVPSNSYVCLESKKRKRNFTGSTMNELLNELFLLKPYPANKPVRTRTLQPLLLIPRSCLPLSFLDISSSASSIGQSRLFEAYIKALESVEGQGSQPMVLIARDEESRVIFALERESRGLYALCQIGLWANIQQLYDAAVASKLGFSKIGSKPDSSLTIQPIKPRASNSNEQKKRLAIQAIQSMVRKFPSQLETEPHLSRKDLDAPLTGTESCLDSIPKSQALDEKPPSQVSISDIFENVRMQYFDTLYLSRVSLAYFAKGPLSRARAAINLGSISKSDQNDYISLLQSLIIPINLMDKKFRDGVPNRLLQSDMLDHDVHNTNEIREKKNLIPSKLGKIGKIGLYAFEDQLIQKWWAAHDGNDLNPLATESLKEHLIKTRISQLRIRETQLQIILMLEILALQPSFLVPEEDRCQPLTMEIFNESRSDRKSKKHENLLTLIDIHIDRLCIWLSVSESHETPSMKTQYPSIFDDESKSRARDAENLLRDFSVDVILPFFSSRLPTQCASINKKLGVSVVITGKTNHSKSTSKSAALSRPGAATNRSLPGKPRPSLKRILKDERKKRSISQSHDKAISLMKSASMPVLSIVDKKCNENSSVTSISCEAPHKVDMASSLNLKRSLQREVCSPSLDHRRDSRVKKSAMIESELNDVIAAIRKPNRQLSARDATDSANGRTSFFSPASTSNPPPDDTLRKRGVQIFATPKTHRQKLIIDKSQNSCARLEIELPTSHLPNSPSIPLSASINTDKYFFCKDPLFRSIQATPTGKLESGIVKETDNCFETDNIENSSPLFACRSSAELFGSVSTLSGKGNDRPKTPDCMIRTSVKVRDKKNSQDRAWLHPQDDKPDSCVFGVKSCNNIYQTLGWDDELS